MWCVYRATSPSGKCYIGITSRSLETRKRQHFYTIHTEPSKFHSALIKYKDSFVWEVLLYVNQQSIAQLIESKLVEFHMTSNTSYNMVPGGGVPPSCSGYKNGNFKFTDEQVLLVYKLFDSKISMRKISKLTGISKTQVANILHGDQRGPKVINRKPHKKLSIDQVNDIKISTLSNKELSLLYNVSPSTISSIVNGTRWHNAQTGHYGGLTG